MALPSTPTESDPAEDTPIRPPGTSPGTTATSQVELPQPFHDSSDTLMNERGQMIQFQHIPSQQTVKFKAFVTQYEENFRSDWASDQVYGRMDPIHTFKGTQRTINLGWDVLATTREEAKRNLRNVSKLYTMLYPVYKDPPSADAPSSATHISAAPLLRLRFGNLIMNSSAAETSIDVAGGLVGRVEGFNFAPSLEHGFVNGRGSGDNPLKGVLYPKLISISCTFHVIHTHKLGWKSKQGGGATHRANAFNNKNFPYGNEVVVEFPTPVRGAISEGGSSPTGPAPETAAAAASAGDSDAVATLSTADAGLPGPTAETPGDASGPGDPLHSQAAHAAVLDGEGVGATVVGGGMPTGMV